MGPQLTVTAGLLGLAWWLFSYAFKRGCHKAKILSLQKPLTLREPDELSVLSYNVLSDNLVLANPSYNYADELYRSWEYRFDKLKDQFTLFNADIICLQEVEINRWPDWNKFMDESGYTGVLLRRQTRTLQTLLGISLQSGIGNRTEVKVYVIDVHLDAFPGRTIERTQQVRTILSHVETDQAKSQEESDLIFCGDFNSSRCHAPWQYLYRGRLESGYTEPFNLDVPVVKETTSHPFALSDVYKTAGAIPEFTHRAPEQRRETDFIFASRHLKVGAVLRLQDLRLIKYVDRTFLPNKYYPSDHLPIGAVLLQSKSSDGQISSRTSLRQHPSTDIDSSFVEGNAAAPNSDNENNIEVHASVGSLDPNGDVALRTRPRTISLPLYRFIDDTALA